MRLGIWGGLWAAGLAFGVLGWKAFRVLAFEIMFHRSKKLTIFMLLFVTYDTTFKKPLLITQKIICQKSTRNGRSHKKNTWFNPLYSSYVKTNVGKTFRKLIVKLFSKHKISNENTIKASYSHMPNMPLHAIS